MLLEQLKQSLGIEGWVFVVATVTFAITRLLKPLPQIPKNTLPWVALAVAFVAVAGDALLGGSSFKEAAHAGFNGLIAGTFAIAGKDALKPVVAKLLSPQLADAIFGKPKPEVESKSSAASEGDDDEPDVEIDND